MGMDREVMRRLENLDRLGRRMLPLGLRGRFEGVASVPAQSAQVSSVRLAGAGGGGNKILLPIPGGVAPDDTGSGNAPAAVEKLTSSGQATNTPRASWVQLAFDQTLDEHWMWPFMLPDNYQSGGRVRFLWGLKVATGDVVFKAGIAIGTQSDTDMDVVEFNNADLVGPLTGPGTVGFFIENYVDLDMTGAHPGASVVVFFGRDADHADDTAAGDAVLTRAIFEFNI